MTPAAWFPGTGSAGELMTDAGRVTIERLVQLKRAGGKFSVLTCYDAAMARLMDASGLDVLLVGDTAAEVVLGLPSTRAIQPEVLIELTAAVRRGATRAMVLADLPFACRSGGTEATVEWVRRFIDCTGADAVKIEVTSGDVGLIEAATAAGLPTVAHLGLLPQAISDRSGYRAQGREAEAAARIIADAARFEQAGSRMLLLEAVASEVAAEVTARAGVPVIGCCAGPACDGTVVVLHDMIGLGGGHPPRSVRRYADLGALLGEAFAAYARDVREGRFPVEAEAIHMKSGEAERLAELLGRA